MKALGASAGPSLPAGRRTIFVGLLAVIGLLMSGAGIRSGASNISGRVQYGGIVEGPVRVEVFDRPQFSPKPAYMAVISEPGLYEIEVRAGTYYLRAYIDRNENQSWDAEEPFGVYSSRREPAGPPGELDPFIHRLVVLPLASRRGIDIQIDSKRDPSGRNHDR